ncbi:unnamed protein product, partial [Arabidopsis halleri]
KNYFSFFFCLRQKQIDNFSLTRFLEILRSKSATLTRFLSTSLDFSVSPSNSHFISLDFSLYHLDFSVSQLDFAQSPWNLQYIARIKVHELRDKSKTDLQN